MSVPAQNPAQREFEMLADSLTASADLLHRRLLQAMRGPAPGGSEPAISQQAAQALFADEVLLRQRAMELYLQAATLAGGGLGGQLAQLLAVTVQTQEKIRTIAKVKDAIALVGELVSMAAAVATGAPEKLVTPYENLKQRLASM